MKYTLAIGIAISCGVAQTASAQEVPGDAAVQNQWFTGTLEAPSPALPEARRSSIHLEALEILDRPNL